MKTFSRIWLVSILVVLYGLLGWFLVLMGPFMWVGIILGAIVFTTILSIIYSDGGKE